MNKTGNCFIETQYKYKSNGIYDIKQIFFVLMITMIIIILLRLKN